MDNYFFVKSERRFKNIKKNKIMIIKNDKQMMNILFINLKQPLSSIVY